MTTSKVVTAEPAADFLDRLAQNDYMIDQHMLPDGKRLQEIAAHIRAHPEVTAEPLYAHPPVASHAQLTQTANTVQMAVERERELLQPTEPLRPKTYSQGMIDAIKLCRKVRYSDSSPDSEEANKWFDAACERIEAAISAHVENPLPSESAHPPVQPTEPQ